MLLPASQGTALSLTYSTYTAALHTCRASSMFHQRVTNAHDQHSQHQMQPPPPYATQTHMHTHTRTRRTWQHPHVPPMAKTGELQKKSADNYRDPSGKMYLWVIQRHYAGTVDCVAAEWVVIENNMQIAHVFANKWKILGCSDISWWSTT